MLFSSRPLNVLADLIKSGHIEIEYTFDRGGRTTFTVDRDTAKTALFMQVLEALSRGGEQRVGFKITPRPAQGKPFTTGNDTLDRLAGDTLSYIQGNCEFPKTQVRVETRGREHQLVFPRVFIHLGTGSDDPGEFAQATDLVISTKGTVTFGNVAATSV